MSNDDNKKYNNTIISTVVLGGIVSGNLVFADTTELSLREVRTVVEQSILNVESYIDGISKTRESEKQNLSEELLTPSLNEAKSILENDGSSIEDLTAANNNLNKALNFIRSTRVTSAAKLELLNKINDVRLFLGTVVIGEDIGEYSSKDEAILLEVMMRAEAATGGTSTLPDSEYSNLTAELELALQEFKTKIIVIVDKTELIDILNLAEEKLNQAVIGDRPGNYYKADHEYLTGIVSTHRLIATDDTARLSKVKESIKIVTEELNSFMGKRIEYININRQLLQDTISRAQLLHSNNMANVGFNYGNCLESELLLLAESINDANNVNSNTNASQKEIDVANENLISAIKRFNDSIINIDKSELSEKITEAGALILGTQVGDQPGMYPQSERTNLEQSLEYANQIYESIHYDKTEIDNAVNILSQSIEAYKNSKIDDIKPPSNDGSNNGNGGGDIEIDNSIQGQLNRLIDEAIALTENHINLEYLRPEILDIKEEIVTAINERNEGKIEAARAEELLKSIENKITILTEKEAKLLKEIREELFEELKECILLSDQISIDEDITVEELEKSKKEILREIENEISNDVVFNEDYIEEFLENISKAFDLLIKNENVISDYDKMISELKESRKNVTTPKKDEEDSSNPTPDNNNNNNENNGSVTPGEDSGTNESDNISEEESEKIAICEEKLNLKLQELQVALSLVEVGFEKGNCTENEKRAAMYMIAHINSKIETATRIWEYESLLSKANATLSDFNDRSISINSQGTVNGRKLTGQVYDLTVTPEPDVITSYEEFIPEAGMPIDVKLLLTNLGVSFVALGSFLRRKKK